MSQVSATVLQGNSRLPCHCPRRPSTPEGTTLTDSSTDLLHLYWDAAYVAPQHVFDTTRKSRDLVERLAADPVAGTAVIAPDDTDIAAATAAIARWHAAAYVAALRTGEPAELAESQGFRWDPGIWNMATHSTAGVLAAVRRALEVGAAGSLSSGLHHARTDRGAGFCTVNGLVAAVDHARQQLDTRGLPLDVLILDVDAHCGGGTSQMLEQHPELLERTQVIDLSVDAYDHYRAHPDRATLVMWPDDVTDDYLTTLDRLLEGIDWGSIGLVLHNAGMDPFPIVARSDLRAREQLIARRCLDEGVPVAFVLAGGYTIQQSMAELVELHVATVEAFVPLTARAGLRG
jgi:acetoin utilization deacetylase AcuC-like enzyme